MNEQKAIEYLKHYLWCMRDEPPEDMSWEDMEEWETEHNNLRETFEFAIQALEKQVAKKPKEVYEVDFDVYKFGTCPECNEGCNSSMNYCDKCSQKLDWNDN